MSSPPDRPAPFSAPFSVRGAHAEVSAAAIEHNLQVLDEAAGPASICAVVKANGYGLGAELVAGLLQRAGVEHFAVATVEEGLALRTGGIEGTILILGGGTWVRAPAMLQGAGLTPVISSAEEVRALSGYLDAASPAAPLEVHLVVDTGMGREGAVLSGDVEASLRPLLAALAEAPHLRAVGVMSHFANADLADPGFTEEQIERFAAALRYLGETSLPLEVAHLTNSAATLSVSGRPGPLADPAFDRYRWWARPGLALWGATPFPDGRFAEQLRPAVRWTAPVVLRKRVPAGSSVSYGSTFTAERETELAVIGLGYADGLHRAISGRGGEVLIAGRRAPIAGRVCMDLTCVDVTDVVAAAGPEACALGSTVTLLGEDGDERIDAWTIAEQAGTIAYEVLTSIAARVPRIPVG